MCVYTCGYLLCRIFIKYFCDTCAILAQKDCNLDTSYTHSYFKAYDNEKNTFGNLYV